MNTTMWVLNRLKLDDAAANGNSNRLRAVLRAELVHDVFDVDLDRLFGDKQDISDVLISVAAGNLAKDFDFAGSQFFIAHVIGQLRRDFRRHPLFPGVDLANRIENFAGWNVL